jgi:hypothetical protein
MTSLGLSSKGWASATDERRTIGRRRVKIMAVLIKRLLRRILTAKTREGMDL